MTIFSDEHYMKQALLEAEAAFEADEIPVGAVVVCRNRIIARAHNQTELLTDVTAHAEMLAITQASGVLSEGKENHRGSLEGATLYSTLEPCPMCAGAMVLTKCQSIIFGARDSKAGACESLYKITNDDRLNHRLKVLGGVMENESRYFLQEFFKSLRKERR